MSDNVHNFNYTPPEVPQHIEGLTDLGHVGISGRVLTNRDGSIMTDRQGKPVISYWLKLIQEGQDNIPLCSLPLVGNGQNGRPTYVNGSSNANWIAKHLAPMINELNERVQKLVGSGEEIQAEELVNEDTPF